MSVESRTVLAVKVGAYEERAMTNLSVEVQRVPELDAIADLTVESKGHDRDLRSNAYLCMEDQRVSEGNLGDRNAARPCGPTPVDHSKYQLLL